MHAAPRVLIVDDVIENVAVLGETLSDAFEIQFATSGPEALELVAQSVPDLILLDVMMPGMDGYEVCTALKRDPKTRDVPVIFVTAKSDAESESRALAGGAVDFIHKPINHDVVRARVQLQIALRSRELEMQDLHAQLERVLSERTRALGNALQLAQGASRGKAELLTGIGREIRVPATSILGWSDLALKSGLTPKQRDYVENIQLAGQRLLEFLDDVTDSFLDAGAADSSRAEFDLEVLVDQAFGLLSAHLSDKGLDLTVDFDPGLPQRFVGAARPLRRALSAQLETAISLAVSGDLCVAIALSGEELRVEVRVRNPEAPGSLATDLAALAASADPGAVEVGSEAAAGYAAARKLVAGLQGRSGMESRDDGAVVLWCSVPLEVSAPAAEGPLPGATGKTVIVAVAHARGRSLASGLVARTGCTVIEADSAPAAAEEVGRASAAGTPVDLVILGWDTLSSDAAAAVTGIRAGSSGHPPQVVMLIPPGSRAAVESARAEGVDGILTTPLLPGALRRVLSRLLEAAAAPAVGQARSPAEDAGVPGARVLLVEDNAINRLVASEQLKHAGYLVDVAHDGAVAVEKVREGRYDVVLMDLLMPVMDGLTSTREIRKLPQGDDLPIIAMTASSMDQDRQRCLDAGMNDFVAKPIVAEEFWPKLKLWIERHREIGRASPESSGASALSIGGAALEAIPGLDVLTGLKQSLGRRALYMSLLERFVAGQRDFPERIEAALARADWPTAERLAHTLKGVSAQIGATELRDLAERLVLAIRRHEPVAGLRSSCEEIAVRLDALTRAISVHLPDSQDAEGANRVDPRELRSVCQQLAEQLTENYLTALPYFERHEALLRAAFGEDFQRLSDAIYVYDFDIALEWLKEAAALRRINL
ncbi:MAG: hypothetical protein RIS35_3622 [Pseudomonadota bacterium]